MLSTYESDAMVGKSFFSPFAWEQNHKGNLVRRWKGMLLTVFNQSNGFWGYSIKRGRKRVTFNDMSYETDSEAMVALKRQLEQEAANVKQKTGETKDTKDRRQNKATQLHQQW